MSKDFDFDFIKKNQREFVLHNLEEERIFIAVSGGVDSVVLFDHLFRLRIKMPKLKLECIHVHHGVSSNLKVNTYRNRAQKFVEKLCKKNKVPFHTNQIEKSKDKMSEEDLRSYRNAFFEKCMKRGGILATAHHLDDVAETILIRLIRGTGLQGMDVLPFFDKQRVRPLVHWTKVDVLRYAQKMNLKYVEDPSNKSQIYLRNWIRNKWLKDLESYRPGSESVFKKSLLAQRDWVCSHLESQKTEMVVQNGKIVRRQFLFLNKAEQRAVLASLMRELGIKNYKTTHIDEILKRLDSPKKVIKFELLKYAWTIDTEHMWAQPL